MGSSEQLPILRDPDSELDPYESEYMSRDGEIVWRSKLRSNWQVHAFTGTVALVGLAWCFAQARFGVGIALAVWTLLTGVFFSVIRASVSTTHVDVHYGLFGPRIPIAAIESAEPVTHEHRGFLRWGISPLGRGEWLHMVPGDEGRAVKITWVARNGQRRVHWIGSHDPEGMASAIHAAKQRAALPEPSE